MKVAPYSSKKNTPGLNFCVDKVETFNHPKNDTSEREKEKSRNTEFYRLMHASVDGKSKIDEIFEEKKLV